MQEPVIRKIAVLGAGVMGAQIAAHGVNAGIETLLFDLAAKENHPNALVLNAIAHLKQLKPTPLATPETASLLKACNYDEHLAQLSSCDLIIEAIGERLDWKERLYERIVPFLNEASILVSNTSGLSINALASVLPETHRSRFCGMHFFNPPRYMHLVELIPATTTAPELLNQLESWLTRRLGKGVVRAKDTPNFIANRIGVFSLLATLHHAEAMGLGLDAVDALTGGLLGRPRSATFRTMDVVGLDTMAHVVATMEQQLTDDPWHRLFVLPTWLTTLIDEGHLGQKSGQGIYRKQGKIIEVYDINLRGYRPSQAVISDEIKAIMRLSSPRERLQQLCLSTQKEAQFLAACFYDLFHYSAFHLAEIATDVRDVDLAMRWGFGWQEGPFETWQSAGVGALRELVDAAIAQGRTICDAALPTWLLSLTDFYKNDRAFSPTSQEYVARRPLPVYARQSVRPTARLFENEGICLSSLHDDVAVISFKTKANSINQAVLDGFSEALSLAEQQCQGLIIHQEDSANFSAGADLRAVFELIRTNRLNALETMIAEFQRLVMRIKYSRIPVVAALRGRALGGGCELLLHCSAVVAAFEAYPGLVEVGVGLIPAGGGCKEMAARASMMAHDADLMTFIGPYFKQMATAVVAGSAPEALALGYLKVSDHWVMHHDEVLYAAIAKVKAMQAMNYAPPLALPFSVMGREGRARLEVGLVNWLEGGFISQHDYYLASQLASVLCGGDVNEGTRVDEAWILGLERAAFMALAATPLTAERIRHFLETGRPLRN